MYNRDFSQPNTFVAEIIWFKKSAMEKSKIKRVLYAVIKITVALIIILIVGLVIVLNLPRFGKLPSGERLERIKKSTNFKDGKFTNLSPTPTMTNDESTVSELVDYLFQRPESINPDRTLPSEKVDLKSIPQNEDVVVWLGHAAVYMQISGKRILVDPALVSAAPFSFLNKPFPGTTNYTPGDIPGIDYLLITHDHWDHLDQETLLQLKGKTRRIICPLGVGEHLEYWGFPQHQFTELDWNDSVKLDEKIIITALPARHFSGRGLTENKTLWASYMIQSPLGNIFISGDSGYDEHFKSIKKTFGRIFLAIMENGQYDKSWKFMHMLPADLQKAVVDLDPDRLLTVHHSKFALARHSWNEPMTKISKAFNSDSLHLIYPIIGEQVNLQDSTRKFIEWWK